ncbi:hypothetical protein NH340_JMT04733 [Sarcoptes scabiei]|nr:hypothetical protein NH340_JMT04733 [Sarcoptes scabiei]
MRSMVMCSVIAGDPPIRIHWLKDGQPLLSSVSHKIEMVNEFTSSITFQALKRHHAGRYTCIASNLAAIDYHYADLNVNVAPVWLQEPKDIVAVAGQNLMIDCQARGVPGPQIRWKVESIDESISSSSSSSASAASASIKKMKNRLNPILGSRSEQPDATLFHTVISNPHIQILENGSLMIKEVNWNDNRRYMCTAFNGIGSGISTIIRLSVHFPPKFLSGNFEQKQIKQGEMAVLNCLIKIEFIENQYRQSNQSFSNSYDDVVDIRWFRESNPHQTSTTNDRFHNDRYHLTQAFEITDLTSDLTLNFSQLIHSNQNDGKVSVKYFLSKLTIRHVDRSDTSSYVCFAQNYYGFVSKNFTLIVMETPDRPEEIKADEITSTSIKLTWPMPFDGNSPITEYVVAYRTIMDATSRTITLAPYATYLETDKQNEKKFISFQLNDLIPATAYVIQVKAKNSIGYSVFGDSITIKTSEEPPNDVPDEIEILPLSTRSLKISWRSKNDRIDVGKKSTSYIPPIVGYYIGYRQHSFHQTESNNPFIYKTFKSDVLNIVPSDSDPSKHHFESFILNNLKRSTRYDIKIQAFNQAGAGPSSSEFQSKTLDFDVPSAPRIRALRTNASAIELMVTVQGEEPINGFVVSYKPAYQNEIILSAANIAKIRKDSDWKTVKIESESDFDISDSASQSNTDRNIEVDEPNLIQSSISISQKRTFLLENLLCGSKYYVFVNAYNGAGQGDPSEVIMARTDGNIPVPPEFIQEFIVPNCTTAKILLHQWKTLGCSIVQFDIDFRVYGDSNTNRRLTMKPFVMDELENSFNGSKPNTTELIIELNDLKPASWYEISIKATTESGSITRDYIFSTFAIDGSTIAPLTLKAMGDYAHPSHQQRHFLGTSLVHSIRSSMFAQLHYIIPVICTLVILFLVFVVVCAIQANRENFVLSLVTNHRNRHHKVATDKLNHTTTYDPSLDSNRTILLESTQTEPSTITNASYCTTKDHLYGTTLNSSKLTTSESYDDLLDGGERAISGTVSVDAQNNSSRFQIRTNSCHSIGLLNCDHHHQHLNHPQHHLNHHQNNLFKKANDLKAQQQQQQQYPLYSLPVPYATSSVQQTFLNDSTLRTSETISITTTTTPPTTATPTTTATIKTNGESCLIVGRKSIDDHESIYGTIPPLLNQTIQSSINTKQSTQQFIEMYCDGTKFPFTLTEPSGSTFLSQSQSSKSNETISNQWAGQSMNLSNTLVVPLSDPNDHNRSQKSNHQYELPFVFKPIPINPNNESTAF